MQFFTDYLSTIEKIKNSDNATELSYRTPIENMLNLFIKQQKQDGHEVRHEPSREHGNTPDFRVTSEGALVGYIECKKIGEDLHAHIQLDQIKRYSKLSPNLLLTDGWQWLLLRNGKLSIEAMINKQQSSQFDLSKVLNTFLAQPATQITDANELANALAQRCKNLRDSLKTKLRKGGG